MEHTENRRVLAAFWAVSMTACIAAAVVWVDMATSVSQTGTPATTQRRKVETLKDSWEYELLGGCATKCVETVRKDRETEAEFLKRHQNRVAAAAAACPPKGS